jgi:Arc/MetJ family transcription regulator
LKNCRQIADFVFDAASKTLSRCRSAIYTTDRFRLYLICPRPDLGRKPAVSTRAPAAGSALEPVRQGARRGAAATRFDEYTRFVESYTRRIRTNIDIDDDLMRQAMRSSGARTKRAAVEEGLRLLIRTRDQRAVRRLRGKVTWEGDLGRSRVGRLAK